MIKENPIGKNVLKELMDNGYTWLKRDDLGYGSIQEKFGATDAQIALLRKHPLAKDLETTAVIFTIIDDSNEPKSNARATETAPAVQNIHAGEVPTENRADIPAEKRSSSSSYTTEDELAAFANL